MAKDEWCTKTHGESGLTVKVVASKTTPEQAATDLLDYIKKFIPEPKRGLLAGNSVHADKAFLRKEPYKKVHDLLSHRILDVSTLKELARRWKPELAKGLVKQGKHEALADIYESIEELKYYRETFLKL